MRICGVFAKVSQDFWPGLLVYNAVINTKGNSGITFVAEFLSLP